MIVHGIDLNNIGNVSFYIKKIKLMSEKDDFFVDKELNIERKSQIKDILNALKKLYPEEFI